MSSFFLSAYISPNKISTAKAIACRRQLLLQTSFMVVGVCLRLIAIA